jgi:hypothetical protein
MILNPEAKYRGLQIVSRQAAALLRNANKDLVDPEAIVIANKLGAYAFHNLIGTDKKKE